MEKRSSFKIAKLVIFDLLIIFSAFNISFFLRGQLNSGSGSYVLAQYSEYFLWYIGIVVVVKMVLFMLFGMYRRVWKYASIKDMMAIIEAVVLSSFIMAVIFYILSQPIHILGTETTLFLPYFPRSILIIDSLITFILLIISRFSERFFNDLIFGKPGVRKKRVLIAGAGDAGEMIVREMTRQKNSEYVPIGFIDDDRSKIGNQIHGVKVFGPLASMENMIQKYSIDEVLVTMPSAPGKVRRDVTFRAKEAGVVCKTSPSLYEIIDGKVYLDQIKDIGVEDILGREAVKTTVPEIISEIKDKVILVTGAGGSIGSEICRQLLRFAPAKMILVDHSENNLFMIEKDLTGKLGYSSAIPIVANIRDKEIMKSVFKRYRPVLVFHTAAYKHVPLMQLNPEAAIQNNFLGTKELAKIATKFGVKRFVMLSSDKAVKPKSIMGTSKLLSEKYLKAIDKENDTKFMIVRFGNVLESHGSVVNLFKEQIQSGGPVRVTHPNMTRYLMTIPEASQLAIQACIMGNGGEVYVLNMGKPISILDLATNMIKLFGREPGKDIEIIYTGPRDGEKMSEELVCEDEELIESGFEHISEARNNKEYPKLSDEEMLNILFNIEKEIQIYDYNNLFKDLKKIIPEFDEKEMWFR